MAHAAIETTLVSATDVTSMSHTDIEMTLVANGLTAAGRWCNPLHLLQTIA
jgi:hypothetical protein